MEMFGGVLVFRGVATADVTAFQTEAQVDPVVSGLEALLATLGRRWLDILDLTEVGTGSHGFTVRAE